MDSLAILIPLALILCAGAIIAFIWAVKSDQFEDLERHGQDILFETEMDAEVDSKTNSGDKQVD